ncbi:Actin-interacting protein 1 [Madurella mycetomatis]|uniref:Actin-interacting protein 1 n=1 Tax=Madurella mycetomatis TaxID=100816 RepID=A0A175WEL7_9PEZI|nr:Actin-interacting protein 1 [Madurella mycetomatis]
MSVHISPATRDAWSYAGHGDFYVEASGNRHRRATIPELKAVYKGSDGSRDPPGHWYEAQLIHYGLQPSKTKGTAKMRLFDALNKGSLSVPAHILKVEGDLKKDWNKREREAKQATKSAPAVATSSKGSRKRKADDAQINASYETVDITLGVSVSRRRGEIRVMPANAAPKKAKTTATGSGGKLAKPAKAASKGKGRGPKNRFDKESQFLRRHIYVHKSLPVLEPFPGKTPLTDLRARRGASSAGAAKITTLRSAANGSDPDRPARTGRRGVVAATSEPAKDYAVMSRANWPLEFDWRGKHILDEYKADYAGFIKFPGDCEISGKVVVYRMVLKLRATASLLGLTLDASFIFIPQAMSIDIEKILAASPATTRGQPTQLSCDAKGERIAYASGKSIYLRNIDDPAICKQYTGHTTTTTVAKFSPSGFWVASGDVSGKVRVWDAVEAVNTKGEYAIISGRIADIAWDGDSQRIIAVGDGRERFGHCITADSGNSVGEVSGHSKVVNAVALRQQRPLRAATVSDDSTMCFLHGAPFKFSSKAAGLHKGFVMGTAFSPDGATLVTVGADRRIQLYDGKTGEPTKQIGEGVHTGSVFAVSWAKDSKRFVTASADQTVRMWDAEAGECMQTWRLGEEGSVSVADQQVGVVWPHSRTDGLIISLSLSGDLNYLSEGSAKPVRVVQGHNKSVTALGIGSDGKGTTLTTGSFDGRVCIWDVSTGIGSAVEGQAHSNQVTQFASASGQTYSVGWDDTLRTIQESTNNFVGTSISLTSQPKGIATTSSGYVIVAVHDGIAVYAANSANNQPLSKLPTKFTPTAVAAHGSFVAVGADDNAVQIYTLETGSGKLSPTTTRLTASTAQISALSFSPDGKHLAVGNAAGKIVAYRAGGAWDVATDRWSAHTARVLSVAWNRAGTHAVSGGLDTNVHVWSLTKPGSRVKAANAHKDGVYGVAWVDGDQKVASSGGDAAVKIWAVKGLQ